MQETEQQQWLEALIARLGGSAGTVHVQRDDDLYLTASHNIPPQVIAIVSRVPHGKGMAGVAQVKKAPVQTGASHFDRRGEGRQDRSNGPQYHPPPEQPAVPCDNYLGLCRSLEDS